MRYYWLHLVYIFEFLPKDIFRLLFPILIFGLYNFTITNLNKRKSNESIYMCTFYIFFFSLVGHKEPRFLLPITPFLFLITGHQMITFCNKFKNFARLYICLHMTIEISYFLIRLTYADQFWDAMPYIVNKGDNPVHSLYTMQRYETPYYSWLH